MVRLIAAAFAISAIVIGGAAPAQAASSGMSAEFPVGTCISYKDDPLHLVNTPNLIDVTVVPCTDPGRDYRVTQWVAYPNQCGPETAWAYTTRDLVILCVVQDFPPDTAPH